MDENKGIENKIKDLRTERKKVKDSDSPCKSPDTNALSTGFYHNVYIL